MCLCIKDAGHRFAFNLEGRDILTEEQVNYVLHQCAHGRRWM